MVEHDTGLQYALLIALNSHISTTLSHSLWKNVNDSKCFDFVGIRSFFALRITKIDFVSKFTL